MKRTLIGLTTAAVVALAATSAQAVSVNWVDEANGGSPWANVSAGTTLAIHHGTWSTTPHVHAGNLGGSHRSPFDGSNPGDPDAVPGGGYSNPLLPHPAWAAVNYLAIGPSHVAAPPADAQATLNFSQTQNSFAFLWGSVDTYNAVEFWLTGGLSPLFILDSTDLALFVASGRGAVYASVTDILFDRLVFRSNFTGAAGGTNALEFASITTTIPLPPALLLFGSALAGLGYLARRRRQTTGPVAA